MADVRRRLPQNVAGEFFVDGSCIDCDTCRAVVPETFRDHGAQSSVHDQPASANDRRRALKALVPCPTGSIGTITQAPDVGDAVAAFPELMADDVNFCGFTSEKSRRRLSTRTSLRSRRRATRGVTRCFCTSTRSSSPAITSHGHPRGGR